MGQEPAQQTHRQATNQPEEAAECGRAVYRMDSGEPIQQTEEGDGDGASEVSRLREVLRSDRQFEESEPVWATDAADSAEMAQPTESTMQLHLVLVPANAGTLPSGIAQSVGTIARAGARPKPLGGR